MATYKFAQGTHCFLLDGVAIESVLLNEALRKKTYSQPLMWCGKCPVRRFLRNGTPM